MSKPLHKRICLRICLRIYPINHKILKSCLIFPIAIISGFIPQVDSREVCNKECKCYLCEDEVACSKEYQNYGIICTNTFNLRISYIIWYTPYMPPAVLCDGYQDCLDGSDEDNCIGTETCTSTENLGSQTLTLIQRNRCAVPNEVYLVCQDYRDQLNCSHVLESPLLCKVDGYMTTVSRYALCKETSLCDSGLDKNCDAAEGGCVIHKHQFCDGQKDCHEGKDEDNSVCKSLTKQTCKRKFSSTLRTEQLIPLSWVADGVEDCLNGKDEDKESWKVCGEGWTKRYMDYETPCSDVFLCSNISEAFEEYSNLCDRVGICNKETDICEVSRNFPKIPSEVIVRREGHVFIGHHIPGLENLELNPTLKKHLTTQYTSPDEPFGVPQQLITIAMPSTFHSDCRFAYGELYVYLSCSGFCSKAACILKPVKFDSCHNIKDNRVFTLSSKNYLTVASKKKGNYVSNLFPCNNGYCVTYDKVCDLVDNCGDGSDEINCLNHFKCKETGEILPLNSVGDGQYDCVDFSDECSYNKSIIDRPYLSVISWIIGVPATLFNIIIFVRSITQLGDYVCPSKFLNRLMILLISLGDLMVGLYLIVLSIVNIVLKDTYCRERFTWLTSGYCAAMGVVSSTGSQISLFAMVVLSLGRFMTVGRLGPGGNGSKRYKFVAMVLVVVVLLASFLISYLPLLDTLEDVFVNGLYYNKRIKLFIGAPSKQKHIAILEKYYSKFRGNPDLPWSTVRRLVRNMFSQNYGGVNGVKLHFYGNDGVCLFKFFVTPEDPQAFYTLTILVINFACFFIITSSYVLINIVSTSSLRYLGEFSRPEGALCNRSSSLQRKLTMIILTDFFCWIPFIVVSTLHYFLIVDASSWYATFSILILPINSVINPLLYDPYFGTLFEKLWISLKKLINMFALNETISSQFTEETEDKNTIKSKGRRVTLKRASPRHDESVSSVSIQSPPPLLPRAERHALRMKRRINMLNSSDEVMSTRGEEICAIPEMDT